jgi:hypothetical protein
VGCSHPAANAAQVLTGRQRRLAATVTDRLLARIHPASPATIEPAECCRYQLSEDSLWPGQTFCVAELLQRCFSVPLASRSIVYSSPVFCALAVTS